MKPIVVGLGNPLLGDDGIGVLSARRLAAMISEQADVVESGTAGLSLLDLILGRDQAVFIDAIVTKKHEPGTVIQMAMSDLSGHQVCSPHYADLPEVLRVGRSLGFVVPSRIDIVAVEVLDPYTVGAGLSDPVAAAMDCVVETVLRLIGDGRSSAKGDAPNDANETKT